MSDKGEFTREEAIKTLRDLPIPTREHDFSVSLLVEPSFDNHIHLRLSWSKETADFVRKTWIYKRPVIEEWKGDRYVLVPSKELGELRPDFDLVQKSVALCDLVDFIDVASHFAPVVLPSEPGPVYFDGTSYEITFQCWGAVSTWWWHEELPEHWKELGQIVEFFEKFSAKIV